jgi:hypothetical protein
MFSNPPEKPGRKSIATVRAYTVGNVHEAKQLALAWLRSVALENVVRFGLPEVDDRYHMVSY